jgi:hypothetical protein
VVSQWRQTASYPFLSVYTAQDQVGGEEDQEAEEDAPFHDDTSLFVLLAYCKQQRKNVRLPYFRVPKRNVVEIIVTVVVVEEVSLEARHDIGMVVVCLQHDILALVDNGSFRVGDSV